MKRLIQEFNRPDTHLIISDYPEKTKKGQKNYGIAWYTKELIEPLAKKYNRRFIVLAEKGHDNKPKLYADGRILVLRVFDQKTPSLFPVILRWMFRFNHVKQVHVHSEFCANGGVKNLILLLPFILLIKLSLKRITFFSHNVVTNLSAISSHLNIPKGSLKYKFFSLGLSYYYKILGYMVDQFVVMDHAIQKRLEKFASADKISLNPFWIEETTPKISKAQARYKLRIENDELVLLYFGFITHYKGADWIINTVKKLQEKKKFRKVRLILAGGEAYSLKDKPYYQRYYKNILESVKTNTGIQVTGFVPEEKIESYFMAADLCVYSYRGLIGASGSLQHAIRYKKPFILSRKMKMVLESPDIKSVLAENGLKLSDVTFTHDTKSFEKIVNRFRRYKSFRKQLKHVTQNIAEIRSRKNLIDACYTMLYGKEESKRFFPIPSVIPIPAKTI